MIILITFGEDYKLWNSSWCSFLQPSATSSLFDPNILLGTLFSNTLSPWRWPQHQKHARNMWYLTIQCSHLDR
jgi:hypothetical protein